MRSLYGLRQEHFDPSVSRPGGTARGEDAEQRQVVSRSGTGTGCGQLRAGCQLDGPPALCCQRSTLFTYSVRQWGCRPQMPSEYQITAFAVQQTHRLVRSAQPPGGDAQLQLRAAEGGLRVKAGPGDHDGQYAKRTHGDNTREP